MCSCVLYDRVTWLFKKIQSKLIQVNLIFATKRGHSVVATCDKNLHIIQLIEMVTGGVHFRQLI